MKYEIDRCSDGHFLVSGYFEVFPFDSLGYRWLLPGKHLVQKSRRLSGYRFVPPSQKLEAGKIEFNFQFDMDATEPIKNLEDKVRAAQKKAQEDFTREIDQLVAMKDYLETLKEAEMEEELEAKLEPKRI